MPLPVGSTVQVTYEYESFNQILQNTCHWVIQSAGTTADQALATQEIADHFANAAVGGPLGKLLPLLPGTVQVQYVRAQIIAPSRYAYYFASPFEVGMRGPAATGNLDAVITKRTDMAGRREVGNWFLPVGDPEDMLDGLLTPLFIGQIADKMSWLRTRQTMTVSGAQLDPVIFHKATGTASDIRSLLVHPEVRVLTRRTVGRGI